MQVKRVQVTGYQQQLMWNSSLLPNPVDEEFFEFSEVNSVLGSAICTYGYRDVETGKWVKISEATRIRSAGFTP